MKRGGKTIDVAIIGGGIAAHSAAIYAARDGFEAVVFMSPEMDQLSYTTVVENFPGFPKGVLGPELIRDCKAQAEKFGAKYVLGRVESLKAKGSKFEIKAGDKTYFSRAVIIATGAKARTLDVPGKDRYFGKGVAVCAVCDAPLFRGKEVIVIGGGDSAMEDALILSRFASKVTIVHRKDKFRASRIMQDRVFKEKKIRAIWNSTLQEIIGDGKFVNGAKIKDINTGKSIEISCSGIFFAIGHDPNTKVFSKAVKLDKKGFIKTDRRLRTSAPGVFAAGDCQDAVYQQAITAAGSGAQAALEAEEYLRNLK